MDIGETLEDKAKLIETPEEETARATYRRRGSDFMISSTKSNKVMVARLNHRFKQTKYYLHELQVIEDNRDAIKKWLDEGGYKLVERKDFTQEQPAQTTQ